MQTKKIVLLICSFSIILVSTAPICENNATCISPSCVQAASIILQHIDPNVDPCEDFYEYVCGTFIKNAYIDETPSPFIRIANKFENQVKAIVRDPVSNDDPKPLVAIKKFYRTCMSIDRKTNLGKTLKRWIDDLGEWPLIGKTWNESGFDWVNFTIKAQQKGLGATSMFQFVKKEANDENDTVILQVQVDTSSTYEDGDQQTLEYQIEAAVEEIGVNKDDINKQDLKKLVDFIIAYDKEADAFYEENSEITTIKELIKKVPQVPWLKLINDGLGLKLRESDHIFINEVGIINKILKLLDATDKRVQANYLFYHIVKTFKKYLANYPLIADRHKHCLDLVDKLFPHYKEMVFVRRMANAVVQKQVFEMIENIKTEFKDLLSKADWMDDETKRKGIEKADKIIKIVGATDEMYNETYFDKILGVDNLLFETNNFLEMVRLTKLKQRQHLYEISYNNTPDDEYSVYFEDVVDVNAFFAPDFNLMIIPAPILQDLFYNQHAPSFMNYGSIGAVIGHEIMHGFTKRARVFKLPNATEIDWWTNKVEEDFDKKVQCAIKQYESFKGKHKYRMDGKLTMNENVADFVGIDAAYKAYDIWVRKHGEEKKLPGVDLTPNQLYWIQANTFRCFEKIETDETDFDEPDEHGVPRFRVIASVQNSRYFAKDFNCPVGTPMNPKEKCQIL